MYNPFTTVEIRNLKKLPMNCFTKKLCKNIIDTDNNTLDINFIKQMNQTFFTAGLRDIEDIFKNATSIKKKFTGIMMVLNRDPNCMPSIKPYDSLYVCRLYGARMGFLDDSIPIITLSERVIMKAIESAIASLRQDANWKRFIRGTNCY